ncbi:GtrA family protein [Mucilaginibacter psychrotolerans]|uniref:GtrA family protein n=1 Tax=Mucilaginibacter psychrotolerans TaxID=1524096 RepID=A0A4Y8SDX5_9SPHI|nr:GtrA family protein [Mucilaginibacter psychrotolerans]TFF36664.1 GtrA family protein [Mucilaginibacter psychrotolerans]
MAKRLWLKITKSHIIRFLLSASAGFAVDMAAFYLLFHYLFTENMYVIFGVALRNSSVSLAISYALGVTVNFFMTRYLVFSQSKSSPTKQFIRFVTVAFIGFFANLGALKVLIQQMNIYPPYARIGAALSLFVASYFVHKVFSFSLSLRPHQPQSDHHDTQPHHQPGN